MRLGELCKPLAADGVPAEQFGILEGVPVE
jgi:hypothetical protein